MENVGATVVANATLTLSRMQLECGSICWVDADCCDEECKFVAFEEERRDLEILLTFQATVSCHMGWLPKGVVRIIAVILQVVVEFMMYFSTLFSD